MSIVNFAVSNPLLLENDSKIFCLTSEIKKLTKEKFALNECSDEYFDSIIMESCRDKQITSKLEKLAGAVIKKYPTNKKVKSKI